MAAPRRREVTTDGSRSVTRPQRATSSQHRHRRGATHLEGWAHADGAVDRPGVRRSQGRDGWSHAPLDEEVPGAGLEPLQAPRLTCGVSLTSGSLPASARLDPLHPTSARTCAPVGARLDDERGAPAVLPRARLHARSYRPRRRGTERRTPRLRVARATSGTVGRPWIHGPGTRARKAAVRGLSHGGRDDRHDGDNYLDRWIVAELLHECDLKNASTPRHGSASRRP
jgi:hypothetical protein